MQIKRFAGNEISAGIKLFTSHRVVKEVAHHGHWIGAAKEESSVKAPTRQRIVDQAASPDLWEGPRDGGLDILPDVRVGVAAGWLVPRVWAPKIQSVSPHVRCHPRQARTILAAVCKLQGIETR